MIHAACLTTFISDSTVFRFPTRSDAQRPRTHSAPVSVAKDDAQSCWGAEAEGALEIWHNTLQGTYPTRKKGKSSTQKCLFIGDMLVARRVSPANSRVFVWRVKWCNLKMRCGEGAVHYLNSLGKGFWQYLRYQWKIEEKEEVRGTL